MEKIIETATKSELMVIRVVILSLFILVLPACERSNDVAEIQNVDVSPQALRQVTDAGEFEAYIKNGLIVPSLGTVINFSPEIAPVAEPTVTNDVAGAPAENSSGDFSTTNTQEQNVDESDVIKYDGNFLYIATTPEYYYAEAGAIAHSATNPATSPAPAAVATENIGFETGIRVMKRIVDPTGDSAMVEIAWPKLSDTVTVDSLYLYQDTLVSIGNGFGVYETVPVLYDLWYWGEPQTVLTLFDVTVPENIQAAQDIRLDGYLETSRRIDNTLYLVTRYTPYLPQISSLQVDGDTETAKAAIEQAGIDDLLPTISINGVSQSLVNATDCYLPGQNLSETESAVYGYASMLVLTAIDLQQPEKFNSVCFNAMSQGIYTSEKAMYISASTQSNETVIHKFELNKGAPKYSASGFIDGHLGWRNPAFRMSESGDYLRVVSTEQSGFSDFNHQLFVLKDDQQGLMAHSAVLPNESFPEAIGKPGENITAVRFFGSRAYVVTFEQTDPLYVINLDDPAQPFIEGSLEIPGFSSYLHPVNENLLLGIGWDFGVKLSLFDVSDVTKPVELSNFIWEGAYSPLQHDYKALAFIELDSTHYRFAFPLSSYYSVSPENDNGLQLFDLYHDASGTVLNKQGVIQAPAYQGVYRDRAIIHENSVFYIHGNYVWSAPWSLEYVISEQ